MKGAALPTGKVLKYREERSKAAESMHCITAVEEGEESKQVQGSKSTMGATLAPCSGRASLCPRSARAVAKRTD